MQEFHSILLLIDSKMSVFSNYDYLFSFLEQTEEIMSIYKIQKNNVVCDT